ncbi:MAG: hypothetical protein ACJ749_07405 [Flavisolibacter sp.]|jgi:hypothetical protein
MIRGKTILDSAEEVIRLQIELARRKCLSSTLFHTKYFFEKIKRERFIVNEHHRIISEALDKVIAGEITRLIINIAPRYTKTEMAVKSFIQKGLAHNPASKYIHLSYSDTLALDNSDSIRNTCRNPFYQQLFPEVQISTKSDSKKKWYTTAGGGVYATAAGGQVTGFGAGSIDHTEDDVLDDDLAMLMDALSELDESYQEIESSKDMAAWQKPFANFGGALIIDDPIKPEDAFSDVKREKINNQFDSTVRNRVNSKKTPIIIMHQRTHEKDLTGHLLEIEPEAWTVIKLPCLKEDGTALWDLKHSVAELVHLKKISPYVFQSQYQQDPQPIKKGSEFYKLFDYKSNVVKNPKGPDNKPSLYDPKVALHVTYDFNVKPYLSIGIWQIWPKPGGGKKAIKIDEVAARSPMNRTEAASKEVIRRYQEHTAGLFVYGDPSGRKEDTRTEAGHNDFILIMRTLKQFRPSLRVLNIAPPVKTRGDFMNTLFADGYEGIDISIGDNCQESINDYQYLEEDSDGSKLKKKVTENGETFEKYGHMSDGDEYFICFAFAGEFARYQKSGGDGKIRTGKPGSKNSY